VDYARKAVVAAEAVYPTGHRYRRQVYGLLADILLQQAERLVDEAPPAGEPDSRATRAQAFLDEVAKTAELAATPKAASGWLDCLRGAALRIDAARRKEAIACLARGLSEMKKKEKPGPDEKQRIKKAEAWLSDSERPPTVEPRAADLSRVSA
jgi:hypothetical protein